MPTVFIIVIILGIVIGAITFFVIRSIIAPKKVASLANLLKQGKTSAVVRTAKQILAREPRNPEAHYFLGMAYQEENKNELALMELQIVNQIGTFSAACPEIPFRKKIAELYKFFNQPEEALKEYLLLIKMEPEEAEYYYEAGLLFEKRERAEKASVYFRKTIELNPNHSDAHYHLGMILYRSKKPVEAKVEFELAIKIQPDNFKAYYFVGKLLKDNHDYTGALAAFEKAQRDPEQKVKALVERGGCYMSMNNMEKAISELDRAVKISTNETAPETLYGRYFLAMCYEKTREIDKAIEQWEKIYAKKPNFRDVSEKLSQYQDLRTDDRMKDYLTASMDEFYEICKSATESMSLSIRDISDVPNGCQIVAVETESSKWRNARKMPKVLRFLRVPELISESTVRSLHEEMRNLGVARGIIISSSNFSRKAVEYAETRPIDLVNKDQLQELLKNIKLPKAKTRT